MKIYAYRFEMKLWKSKSKSKYWFIVIGQLTN